MPPSPTETRCSPAFSPLVILIPTWYGSVPAGTDVVACQSTNMNGTSRSAASPDSPCARPDACRMSQECTP